MWGSLEIRRNNRPFFIRSLKILSPEICCQTSLGTGFPPFFLFAPAFVVFYLSDHLRRAHRGLTSTSTPTNQPTKRRAAAAAAAVILPRKHIKCVLHPTMSTTMGMRRRLRREQARLDCGACVHKYLGNWLSLIAGIFLCGFNPKYQKQTHNQKKQTHNKKSNLSHFLSLLRLVGHLNTLSSIIYMRLC